MTGPATGRGGSFVRFRTGTTGASARHVAYITRERAVIDREKGILLYHIPDHVRAASDYHELRQTLISYADTREDVEIAKHISRGQPRTHYRVIASFERDISSERALGMAKEWMDREFPNARGFAVIHRDTEQTHVHLWIDARQTDGKKIQLARQQHRSLDLSWNQIYSREMGLDPREHEWKKEQTRVAKQKAWERHQKPELPFRVHKEARDLTPNWERRELGVQAAREQVDHPAGAFLERVRAVATQDLQDARSWDELERRLERHGLRIEAKGAGMIFTDGRHWTKASSVDRDASRGKLEKRFGVSLAEHRNLPRAHEGVSRDVKEIVGDLNGLDRRGWLKADLARENGRLEGARARLSEKLWARERADKASEAFDRALETAYMEPTKARAAFDQRVREDGPDRAADEMRNLPEKFGKLRQERNRGVLGLTQTMTSEHAKERALNAAELGREASTAMRSAPQGFDLGRAEQALRHAEMRVKKISELLEKTQDSARSRIRLGVALRTLAPREVNELHRLITAPHRQITLEVERAVRKLAPEHFQQLANWARAPHLALPTIAARSFRNLLNDRTRERGNE